MRGHEALTRLRLHGYKPRCIFVDDVQERRTGIWDAEKSIEFTQIPEVHIEPDDLIETLDLRCLHGTTVALSGPNVERLRLIFSRIKTFKPKKIITSDGEFLNIYEAKE